MKEYSNGIKGAAIVIHQMFFVLMVCSLYGVGYDIAHHIKGISGTEYVNRYWIGGWLCDAGISDKCYGKAWSR